MNIAYLITAHSDASSLYSLAHALTHYDSSAHAFVHIDASQKQSPFVEMCKDLNRVVFVSERIRVNWSSFSFLRAQLETLRYALRHEAVSFDRFVFLSGLDFPLVRSDIINRAFARKNVKSKNFVGGANLTRTKDKSNHWRIDRYHFFRDIEVPNQIRRILTKAARSVIWSLGIRKPIQAKLNSKRVDVYAGSDWVAITKEFALVALNTFDHDDRFTQYFASSFCPSEMFYHTILNNTKYRLPTAHESWNKANVTDLQQLTPLHTIIYEGSIKVLDERDFQLLMNSKKLFARKLTTEKSEKLRRLIEKEWQNHSPGTSDDSVPEL